jgi:hypothetical protein
LLFALFFLSFSAFASTDIVSQYLSSTQNSTQNVCSDVNTCNVHASVASAPDFCKTFPPAATCNCCKHLQPSSVCESMSKIYSEMVGTYGSLKGACQNQNVTDAAECVADWNCYWDGGNSSKDGKPCNATGVRCTNDPRPPG